MKRLKILLVIPVTVLVIFLGAFIGLRIQNVQVEGGEIYSEQEIIRQAMSDKYAYHSLYFWLKSRVSGVSCLPFVQEIDVEWHSYDRITLHVYDKSISGCVKYMGKYIYFDKDGVVLQSLSQPMEGVPIVTGIEFGTFTLNEAFEVEDDTLFDTIMNLSQLINHYDVDVDQMKFDGKDVTIYSGKVQVHLGEKEFYDDDMAALSSVLKKTRKKDLSGTIDMTRYEPGDKIILKTNDTGSDSVETEATE